MNIHLQKDKYFNSVSTADAHTTQMFSSMQSVKASIIIVTMECAALKVWFYYTVNM